MNAQPEKKPEGTPSLTPAAYNALVAAARLRDIRLLKADFSLDPSGLENESDWKLSQTCEIIGADFDADAEMMVAWVAAEAVCKRKNKKVVNIRCKYMIVYDVQGQPEALAVSAFAKRVARFAAYPYFRAHVAEVGSQAGLRLPPLPVIKEMRLIPQDKAIPVSSEKQIAAQPERQTSG